MFLNFANFYRKFVVFYAKISRFLSNLLKKKTKMKNKLNHSHKSQKRRKFSKNSLFYLSQFQCWYISISMQKFWLKSMFRNSLLSLWFRNWFVMFKNKCADILSRFISKKWFQQKLNTQFTIKNYSQSWNISNNENIILKIINSLSSWFSITTI